MKPKWMIVGVLVWLMVSTSGCGPWHSRTHAIDPETCSPPCWNGIEPGKTTEEELIRQVLMLEDIDPSSLGEGSYSDGLKRIAWGYHDRLGYSRNETGYAYIQDERVISVGVMMLSGITYLDLVDMYGEPDVIMRLKLSGGDCAIGISRAVIYQQLGLMAGSIGCSRVPLDQFKIRKNEQIEYVEYFSPDDVEYVIDTTTILGNSPQKAKNAIKPWPGFAE